MDLVRVIDSLHSYGPALIIMALGLRPFALVVRNATALIALRMSTKADTAALDKRLEAEKFALTLRAKADQSELKARLDFTERVLGRVLNSAHRTDVPAVVATVMDASAESTRDSPAELLSAAGLQQELPPAPAESPGARLKAVPTPGQDGPDEPP